MQQSAISLFRQLPETKSQISKYTGLIRQSVLDGEVEPLLFLQQVTALEQLVKSLKSDHLIKDVILEEAEKYGKNFDHGNANFQIKEVGTKYDFSECGDMKWEELTEKINELTEQRKKREAFLKNIDGEVYGEDGVQILRPVKSSTTQVVITLNK